MKRAVGLTWSLAALAVLLALLLAAAGGLLLASRRAAGTDPSIVIDHSEPEYNRKMVENGSAYDRAAIELGTAKKVVLPHDAVIRRTAQAGKLELFMKKTLAFSGHPPEKMNLQGVRKNMGCAVRTEQGALIVATFGEWDSRIEGGTHMRIIAVVPEGAGLEQRRGLSGPDSAGREWHGPWLGKPEDAKGGYWYGPASPTNGWTAVPDVPDGERTAEQH